MLMRIMKAVFKNQEHPEYGVMSLPFPIEMGKYEKNLEKLQEMGIGGTLERDCFIEKIITPYLPLKCLEGSRVNVDELDYFTKFLDSFSDEEMNGFMGVLSIRKISDLPGMINLAFSCLSAVVVDDFSNWEAVGTRLLTARNGGVCPEKLDRDIAIKTAFDTLSGNEGIVTPYGVFFENRMELQQVYNGRIFPEFIYDPALVAVDITTPCIDVAPYKLFLPMPEKQLERYMERLGESPALKILPEHMSGFLVEQLNPPLNLEQETISQINQLCLAVKDFREKEFSILRSMAASFESVTSTQLITLAQGIEQVHNQEPPEDEKRQYQID